MVALPRLNGGAGIGCRLAFLLLIAGGCRQRSAPSVAGPVVDAGVEVAPVAVRRQAAPRRGGERDGGVADAPTDTSAIVTPEARAAAKRVEASRCRKERCCVTNIWPVGKDRKGRELAVVAFETNEPCLFPQKPAKAGPAAADEESEDRHACGEYWLVDAGASKRPAIAELARQCAGDHWEIGAHVDGRTMTFHYGGQSLYDPTQTSEWTTIGLDPVRLIEVERTSVGAEEMTETWSSLEFAGQLRLGVSGCLPPDAGADSAGSNVPFVEIEAVHLPRPSLPEAFLAGGWRTTGLGGCAARVGGERGFTIHGAKGTATDASMKVLLSRPGELFVEVTDDRFVVGEKSWVKDDHLEIWAATPPETRCMDPSAKSPAVQWGVRVTDGQVFPGFGPPTTPPPEVDVARADERTIRLRMTFEETSLPGPRFTVVYSDSDDGIRQGRLIATSQLVFGKWWTLGVTPGDQSLSCTIVRGALEPKDRGLPGSSG